MQINTLMKYCQWIPLFGIIVVFLYLWYGDFNDCIANSKYSLRYFTSIIVQVGGMFLLFLSLI